MASRPREPTVNSVARTVSWPSWRFVPSGIRMDACVPGVKTSVACREPSASEVGVPCATCAAPTGDDRSIGFARSSTGTSAKSASHA